MMKRALTAAVPLLCLATGTAKAQDLSSYFDRAYEACANHIDSAHNALQGVCTAAAVIDLAMTPESPQCTIARIAVVEYVKACIKAAADMLADGGPVELPPFPTGANQGAIGAEGIAPMPAGWPVRPGVDPMALFGLLFADQQFLIANVHHIVVSAIHETEFRRQNGSEPMSLYGTMVGLLLDADGGSRIQVEIMPITIYDAGPQNPAVSEPAEDVSVGPADAASAPVEPADGDD